MQMSMRLCLFSSYFAESMLPAYVRIWLEQLLPFFDQLVLLGNDDKMLDMSELQWLADRRILYRPVRNEGYDFGMWQKALADIDMSGVQRLALVNDSCILFAPLDIFFDWFDQSKLDVGGMLESQSYTRHMQSFFLVFNGRAAQAARDYIVAHPVSRLGYDEIVRTFELGLSQRFYEDTNFRVGVRFPTTPHAPRDDPSYFFIDELLRAGMPLIKKKMLGRQGPGSAVRRLVMQGIDPAPEARVQLICDLHQIDGQRAAQLFDEALTSGQKQRRRFMRRVLRYRLERLLRQWFGAMWQPGRRPQKP